MIQSQIVQRLRDAAEDLRLHPETPVTVTVRLEGGDTLTGSPLAVEDGEVHLELPGGSGAAAVPLDSVLDLDRGAAPA